MKWQSIPRRGGDVGCSDGRCLNAPSENEHWNQPQAFQWQMIRERQFLRNWHATTHDRIPTTFTHPKTARQCSRANQ